MADIEQRLTRIKRFTSSWSFLFLSLVLIGMIILTWLIGMPQKITFETIQEPITNPLMGWAPWADAQDIHQPHTLVYADLTWREFEPQKGHYDFASFEAEHHLAKWREQGVRVVFRFVMDVPGKEAHLDIPDWLYEETSADGDRYEVNYGKGYSPDYSNPVLIAAHQKAIKVLGAKYGQDDFFAYIQLGSLGHWGEWHIKSDTMIRKLPGQNIRDQYVTHYLDAFPDTHLLMRRPFAIAQQAQLGLYNDMTGDPEATMIWLGWIMEGGEYSQTGEHHGLVPMPEGWRLGPVGGEQTGSLSDEILYGEAKARTLDLVRSSHTTFIGPRGPYNLPPGSTLQPGLDDVMAAVGYRFYVDQARMPQRVMAGHRASGMVSLSNTGIAPFYYPWLVWFYVIDGNGEVLISGTKGDTVMNIFPGQAQRFYFSLPIEKLPPGSYTLGIGIVDPLTGKPAVRLAMANSRMDAIQVLGRFEVITWDDLIMGGG